MSLELNPSLTTASFFKSDLSSPEPEGALSPALGLWGAGGMLQHHTHPIKKQDMFIQWFVFIFFLHITSVMTHGSAHTAHKWFTLSLSHKQTLFLTCWKLLTFYIWVYFFDHTKSEYECKFEVCTIYTCKQIIFEANKLRARSLPRKATANLFIFCRLRPSGQPNADHLPQNADLSVKPSIGYVKHLHAATSIHRAASALGICWLKGWGSACGRSSLLGAEDAFNWAPTLKGW